MKGIKWLVILFSLSVLSLVSGVSALNYKSYANFKVLATQQATYGGMLNKTDDSPEVIKILSTDPARSIQARIGEISSNSPYQGTTNWMSIGSKGVTYLGSNSNSGNSAYIFFQGVKQLYLRTSSYYLTETTLNGTWWTSQVEFNQYG